VLKLEISYRVIIASRILVSFGGFFGDWYIFCMVKYLSFHNSSFCLKILLKCKWLRPQCVTHPLVFFQFYDVTWLAVKPINILASIGENFGNKLSKLKKTGKTLAPN
jgi:hypothetical protein